MTNVVTGGGYFLLGIGFWYVLTGRLYLNSYWGKDIYSYTDNLNYRLVTDHIYKNVRHPIYMGQTLMCFGTALVLNNYIFLGFAVSMLLINIYRAAREDRFLQKLFGEEWEEYKKQTSFFVPF